MTFADSFGITLTGKEEWFNPVLDKDTKLFIDPLLVVNSKVTLFNNARKKLADFFSTAFEIAAQSQPNIVDIRYKLLLSMLFFPEVEEVCLGYASRGTKGSGSAGGFSKLIAKAIYDSINMGVEDISNFELLGIFNDGIGPDRISDTTANILKEDIIKYTQKICEECKIPMKKILIRNFRYSFSNKRWENEKVYLPINPLNGKGVMLVPKDFLVYFHYLSSDAFLDYVWDINSEELKNEFNYWLKSEIKKEDIIKIAKAKRKWVEDFEKFVLREMQLDAYDLKKDPKGVYVPALESFKYAKEHPLALAATNDHEFYSTIDSIVEEYGAFMENNNGYKLLWNDNGSPKSEESAQIMFTCAVKQYCRANNIDLTREANLGRGPVDFKFSSGYFNKVIVELKLAKSTKFWTGLEKQLPKYMEVEECKYGYYIVVCYTEKDLQRVVGIQKTVDKVKEEKKIDLKLFVIDATSDKPSASNIK